MTDCINHTGAKSSDGYGVKKVRGALVGAHRIAYTTAHSVSLADIAGFVVMHKCDNRSCINPDHLSLGTHSDNRRETVSKNRQAKGESIGISKLTEIDVRLIHHGFATGLTGKELARRFHVSEMAISRIRSGKTWRHVKWHA